VTSAKQEKKRLVPGSAQSAPSLCVWNVRTNTATFLDRAMMTENIQWLIWLRWLLTSKENAWEILLLIKVMQ